MNQKTARTLLITFLLGLMVLSGCGQKKEMMDVESPSKPVESRDTATEVTDVKESTQNDTLEVEEYQTEKTKTEHSDKLVVYFSATGHTEPLAKYVAKYLEADIYEIVPKNVYTDADLDYNNSSSRSSQEQNDAAARPEIAGTLPDISEYDTIIIGHPIWWGQAPKIIYTFLESYDWKDKTLVTFCTSASSGLGRSAENLKVAASGNPVWLESRRFPINASENDVIDWVVKVIH